MKEGMRLYEEGLEKYPKTAIVLENVMMALWIELGLVACWLLNPIIGWIYLGAAVVMVYVVLRKLICTDCYYYGKWCHTGWGKLAALMFKRGDTENFCTGFRGKLPALTYGLMTLIPLICIIIAMIREFDIFQVAVLVLLILVAYYSGFISRRQSCATCRMKYACPGCAEKKVEE